MTPGSLFVISTPIGNLDDITYRAVKILNDVDYVVCEDTRVTKRLFDKYDIDVKMITQNEYNENKKIDSISKLLVDGANLALVTDAGTPCISDPGYRLISNIKKEYPDIKVIPVPGPSAVISSLSISGLPSDCFYFIGFLPKKKGRQKKLEEISFFEGSIIIYESPKRVLKTIKDLFNILGNRKVFIAREMTKIYEQTFYTNLQSVSSGKIILKEKGEYVIVVAKAGY
ncbi:MAG: 16S rRNA (cytidine(1402)-2'-O)-methyltransferase [Candidatus Marinimicrobia bacterium]|nr:16S rRNA (cytidine(1402)-2'-O)-methyltransferase [Candidatus Neomarinimicrobiota bacterium]|tara:strand:+ start:12463 stop:13146 length:684 start_codon:yes stop_codon:yes gene_type:complete